MKTTVTLIAPPTAMQPGGYIAKAYADRAAPGTARADLEVVEQAGTFVVTLAWQAPVAMLDATDNPRQFIDAAALFVPARKDAPWITMGSPEQPLEGVLWRADRDRPLRVQAQGLGTVARSEAPAGWTATAAWAGGRWRATFTLPAFTALADTRQLAFAIWQGAQGERAGLKSVSPGWIAV